MRVVLAIVQAKTNFVGDLSSLYLNLYLILEALEI